MPVSRPSASRRARTFRLWSRVRRAMSSARSSIETPALIRRTFDWLSTSLLKGISRDGDRTIFWAAWVIEGSP
jgi:poly(3-hydroxyalkanoate) synthetase